MCVTVKFIATALLALFALPTVPCAGASLPAAAEPLQSAATQTLPGLSACRRRGALGVHACR